MRYENVFANVEKLMERKKINMVQLSKETGIASSTLSEWKAKKYYPTVKNLEKLADYFGVTEAYFLKED